MSHTLWFMGGVSGPGDGERRAPHLVMQYLGCQICADPATSRLPSRAPTDARGCNPMTNSDLDWKSPVEGQYSCDDVQHR
jgi:hypothetical protein